MSRYGVMKHLQVLEGAGLVLTRKSGRRKLHFLNVQPIQDVYERWVDPYRSVWAAGLSDLKRSAEDAMLRHVYELYIRADAATVWRSLTDPEVTGRYFFGTRIESGFRPGDAITYRREGARPSVAGTILEAVPPHRLVLSWSFTEGEGADDPPSRVTFAIEELGPSVRLTVSHEGFEEETWTFRSVREGWPAVLSSLKSLIETGEPLEVAR